MDALFFPPETNKIRKAAEQQISTARTNFSPESAGKQMLELSGVEKRNTAVYINVKVLLLVIRVANAGGGGEKIVLFNNLSGARRTAPMDLTRVRSSSSGG